MILYFSATGNSQYVAERIAEQTGDQAYSITEMMQEGKYEICDQMVGIVCPTYDWGLPSIVIDYLEKVKITTPYIFFIATYGMTPGSTCQYIEKILERKMDFAYSVRMPDNWTIVFDLSTQKKINRFTKTTEQDIEYAINKIKNQQLGNQMKRKMPVFLSNLVYKSYDNARKTQHLSVNEACVGCGLCMRNCPVQAIEMKNGKPVWVKSECVMCLRCLHRCPKFAIEYGSSTKKHGQYVHPKYNDTQK